MSKTLWLVAGAVGLAWLVAQGGSSASSVVHPGATSTGIYLPEASVGAGRYGSSDATDDADDHAEEVRQAKQEFEAAAEELRTAVDDLRYNRWSGQMSTIQSRLEDAYDALSKLEGLHSSDPAVLNARSEVDTMRSHMTRLRFENWRTVRPDLSSSASAIEDEATSVTADDDE